MSCLTPLDIERFAADELSSAEERVLRRHVSKCAPCTARLQAREPSTIFASMRRSTLPEPVWADLMERVRAEQRRSPRGVEPVRRPPPAFAWSRLAAGATGALLLALLSGAFFGVKELPSEPRRLTLAAAPAGFVYLSNPNADVAHLVLGGGPGEPGVQLTMIVDADLDDLF